MSIAQHHERCVEQLQLLSISISDQFPGPELDRSEIDDEWDRYILWATNLGAHHAETNYSSSLDYRLREAPFYRDQVLKLLELLERHLKKAGLLVKGNYSFSRDSLESEAESDEDSASIAVEHDISTVDSGWEISSDSSSEASFEKSSEILSPPSIAPPDLSSRKPYQAVFESIRYTIDCLYQLPIRRPAPIERIRDEAASELGFYEQYDVLYVRDKFPRLEESVAFRLGRMITKRRQLLLYRKRHQDKLQNRPDSIPLSFQTAAPGSGNKKRKDEAKIKKTASEPSTRIQTASQITSKATTLKLKDASEQPAQKPESRPSTSIAASEHTQRLRLFLPPRPRNEASKGAGRIKYFECNYCRLLPVITSDLAWKRHVLADLQPYICTFEDCDRPYHFFATRDAWYEHETQRHRLHFFCNTKGHRTFSDQQDFSRHMLKHHGFRIDADTAEGLLQNFRRPAHATEGECNLCMRHTKKLKLHISRHLEQLALFAIPRADYAADKEEENDDSNVSHKNVEGSSHDSQLFEDEESISQSQSENSENIEEKVVPPGSDQSQDPINEELELLVPDSEITSWDTITNKFQRARLQESAVAPISFLTQTNHEDEKILIPTLVHGHVQELEFRMKTVPTKHSVIQKGILSTHRFPVHAARSKENRVSIPHPTAPGFFTEAQVSLSVELNWRRSQSDVGHWTTFYLVPNGLFDTDVLLGYEDSLQSATVAPISYLGESDQVEATQEQEEDPFGILPSFLSNKYTPQKAIHVMQDWDERYSEAPISAEEFFKPPELRQKSETDISVPINPNADVSVKYIDSHASSGTQDAMPSVNVLKPTPPGSLK